MIRLTNGGAYLINGTELVEDNAEAQAKVTSLTGSAPDKEQAKKATMAYGILEKHNTSGNMASAGVGIGSGMVMGNMMASVFSQNNQNNAQKPATQPQQTNTKYCPNCGKQCDANAKFCPDCGMKFENKVCPNCGVKLEAGTKFCPNCGNKI